MDQDKMKKLDDKIKELAVLTEKKKNLYLELAKAYRMKSVWPQCFGTLGQCEMYTTRIGGMRYFLERVEDKTSKEITQEQYNFIREG